MRYYHTPTSMATIQNTDIKCWQGCGTTEALLCLLVEMQNGTSTLKICFVVLPYSYNKSSNCSSWYGPKGGENLHPLKTLHWSIFYFTIFQVLLGVGISC